jgi:cytochrome c oxidase subunit 2
VRYACIACHLTGDPSLPAPQAAALGAKTTVGPPWTGLWNAPRTFADGSNITNADGAYIRESILDPARRVQAGYEPERTGAGMPSYLGVLKDHEIDSLILFIKTLHKTK